MAQGSPSYASVAASRGTEDQSTNSTNPYYVHASENPSLALVSKVLTGSNYHSWSRAMRLALVYTNKMKFVDGTIRAPNRRDATYEA